MKETVWEPKEFPVYKTVFNTVCERIPLECTGNDLRDEVPSRKLHGEDPHLRDEVPHREVPRCVGRCPRRSTRRFGDSPLRGHKTKYREEPLHRLSPVPGEKGSARSVTPLGKVHETKYRGGDRDHYKTVRETHYKDVTWKVCRPVTLRKEVEVDGGEWKTVKVACRTPVVPKCSGRLGRVVKSRPGGVCTPDGQQAGLGSPGGSRRWSRARRTSPRSSTSGCPTRCAPANRTA
ncbi:MAG: hypothetical protein Ct9H300mP1_22640 [Planctomycetaceae bacterium]|nr:MAG: hypothetical protein Ct9H300mP1_22640 [Planctomycetaceae bacterium]